MDDLSATGIVALVAAVGALVALVACGVLARRLGRLRADQRAVLGERGETDLVGHSAGLRREFQALNDHVRGTTEALQARLADAELRLDGALAYCGLVRYDAYGEMSGRQSTSVALLDAHRSGVVISSIHHRDQARLYAKQVVAGQGQMQLSPEEEEAVRVALAGEVPDAAEQR